MSKSLLVALLLMAPAHASADTDSQPTCAAKEQRILERLAQAEKADNQSQVRGLNKALREMREHCSDEQLAAEQSADIAEAEAEVAQRRDDLAEARREGDQSRIDKREGKLAEALKELGEARAE